MHSFAIDVKGGESRRILPSITKGEIVGHRLSLMSIWKYSRGGDRAIRGADQARGATLEQRRAIGGATYIYAIYMPKKRCYRSKRSHQRSK